MNFKKINILSFFFPDTCIVCGKSCEKSNYVCRRCKDKVEYIGSLSRCRICLLPIPPSESKICGLCLRKKPDFSRLISCVKYHGAMRQSLIRYKFHDRPDLHIGFSKLACGVLENDGVFFDAVACVPVHKETLSERGYNQSALIASKIAKHFEVPFYDDLLIKTRKTKRQSDLNLSARKKNIKNAFGILRPERISGKTVLLVDDIYTSGSTMREAAKVCAPFCDSIIAFTIARGTKE